jgi:Zn-dependent protease/CBS domain-containing protein
MLGGSSFTLGRLFGIRIGVNASWFVILFLAIFWLSGMFTRILGDETTGYVAALVAALLFFGSIVLHELGHALAARRSGIEVSGIDLFFFGGVMKMNRDTDTPGKEFFVAIAGPLVTLGIVAVGTLAGIALAGADGFWNAARLDSAAPADIAQVIVSFLVSMNALLLVFNLVPAFPLDGGRIARAAAWKLTGDRGKATRFAGTMGQGFAVLLIGAGIYLSLSGEIFDGLWLAVLGWLLGQSARSAVLQTAVTERLEGVTVADIMDAEPVTIPADLPAGRAYNEFFLRYQGWPWFAVVETDGRFAGLVHRDAVEAAARDRGEAPVRGLATASAEIREDAPLEALLGSEPLRRLGALMAVDAEGRLRGVVTLEQVSRALQARLAPHAS